MTQSRAMSLVEAVTNVVVGYVLAILTQIVVFPWFGIEAALVDHLAIGLAFPWCVGICCGGCSNAGGHSQRLSLPASV